jgi:hypothetical protein
MSDPVTTNYSWSKPIVGADNSTWGATLNADLDSIDTDLFTVAGQAAAAVSAAAAALPATNGSATGLNVTPSGTPATNAAGYLGTPINAENGNYTFVIGDAGQTVLHNSAASHTYTIPPASSVAFPLGTVIGVANYNAGGTLTITPGAGVTLVAVGGAGGSRTLSATVAMASLLNIGTNTWLISGAGVS